MVFYCNILYIVWFGVCRSFFVVELKLIVYVLRKSIEDVPTDHIHSHMNCRIELAMNVILDVDNLTWIDKKSQLVGSSCYHAVCV